MSWACLARLPFPLAGAKRGQMDIPPELWEELDADAREAAKKAPRLTDEQVRALRLALRPEPEADDD